MTQEEDAEGRLNENAENKFLVKWQDIGKSLATLTDLAVVKDIRDWTVAWAAYSRAAKDPNLIWKATEARLMAERRAGELLLDLDKNKGGGQPGVGRRGRKNAVPAGDHIIGINNLAPAKLSELGISKKQSSKWQLLAALPEDAFNDTVAYAQRTALRTVDKIVKPARDSAAEKLKRKRAKEKADTEKAKGRRGKTAAAVIEAEPEDLADLAERPGDERRDEGVAAVAAVEVLLLQDDDYIATLLVAHTPADRLVKIMGLVADGLKRRQAEAAAMSGGDGKPPGVSLGNGKTPPRTRPKLKDRVS
jgi:hypothetical protein